MTKVARAADGCVLPETIAELAETVMAVVGLHGRIGYDKTKADGTSQKVLEVHRMATWAGKRRHPSAGASPSRTRIF